MTIKSAQELKGYYSALVHIHSWSTVKLDRNGLQFFFRHVLNKQRERVEIVKPPTVRMLSDILSRDEAVQVINQVRWPSIVISIFRL